MQLWSWGAQMAPRLALTLPFTPGSCAACASTNSVNLRSAHACLSKAWRRKLPQTGVCRGQHDNRSSASLFIATSPWQVSR